MATEILEVDGVNASYDNWVLAAGSSKVTAVQLSDDDSTSYIRSTTTVSTLQRYTLAAPVDIQSGDTINSVTVYFRHLRGGTPAGTIRALIYLGGAQTASTAITTGGSWTTSSEALARPGGGSWAYSDLANLEVAVQNGQTREVYCTTLYIVVDYTASVSPVTVPVNTLTLAGSVPSLTVSNVPPPRTISLNTLNAAGSVPSASVVPGAIGVLLDTLNLAGSAEIIFVSSPPPGADVPLNTLNLAGSLIALTIGIGGVNVPANTLTLASSTPQISAVGGPISVALDTLNLVSGIENISVSLLSYIVVNVNTLTLASSVPVAGVIPGAVGVSLDTLVLAGSAPTLVVTPGGITVTLDTLDLIGQAVTITPLAGTTGVTITLDTLNLVAYAVPLASPRGSKEHKFFLAFYYRRPPLGHRY